MTVQEMTREQRRRAMLLMATRDLPPIAVMDLIRMVAPDAERGERLRLWRELVRVVGTMPVDESGIARQMESADRALLRLVPEPEPRPDISVSGGPLPVLPPVSPWFAATPEASEPAGVMS